MSLLEIRDVSVAYDYEREYAIEHVSFAIDDGEYVCLIGSNGSGKSTLLKGLVGLVPLSKGEVDRHISLEQCAYMGQDNLIEKDFPATAWEVVLSGTQKRDRVFPFYTKRDRQKAQEALEIFEVSDLGAKRIGNLSGGQQRRVLLARAFCRDPKLLILDEPCAGLDPAITEEFYGLLGRLNRERHMTILMASHDLEQVASCATRVIVMNRTIEFDGSIEKWKGAE